MIGGRHMALWDDAIKQKFENSHTISATADTHKCPGCASNIYFDSATQKLVCTSCGRSYDPMLFEISDSILDSLPSEFIEEDEFTKHEITCNSCGASIIADKNTSASFCIFCGSPAIINKRLSGPYSPELIIPFKIDKAKATEIYTKSLSKKKFLPRDFMKKSVIEKLTPVYVPFWLVNSDCSFTIDNANIEHSSLSVKQKRCKFRMSKVPFDGSLKINDLTMEQIQPYDYDELATYNSAYLQGYYSERYDEDFNALSKKILKRFQNYVAEERARYHEEVTVKPFNYDMTVGNFTCKYALLPVWFLSYEYDGIVYQIAINGQTGKFSGSTPEDNKAKKRAQALRRALVYAAALIVYLSAVSFFTIALGLESISKGESFFTHLIVGDSVFLVLLLMVLFAPIPGSDNRFHTIFGAIKDLPFFVLKSPEEEITPMAPASAYISGTDIKVVDEEYYVNGSASRS